MTCSGRRAVLKAGLLGASSVVAGCSGLPFTGTESTPIPTGSTGTLTVEPMATNLTVPWDLVFDDDGGLYVTERPGRIDFISSGGQVTTLAELRDTAAVGEGGLLGIALHPEFPETRLLYVYQTYRADGLHNRILRFRRADAGLTDRQTVLDGIPGGRIHDGGRIAFGPDGKLYATTGDSGRGALAQDRASLGGKVLRLDPDGTIPEDNPFGGSPVWSYGHRNPEGLAWHPETSDLYALEHGSSGHDELNRIEAGGNYGWPDAAGRTESSRFSDPVLESGTNTWAPSGAAVYGGDVVPAWRNDLFFATLGFSPGDGRRSLHRVSFANSTGDAVARHEVIFSDRFGRLRAVAVGPDGLLYFTTSNRDGRGNPAPEDDRILQIRPRG